MGQWCDPAQCLLSFDCIEHSPKHAAVLAISALLQGFWIANYVEDASYNYLYLDSQGEACCGQ